MLNITVSSELFEAYPTAAIGVLEVSRIENNGSADPFIEEKKQLEKELRDQYNGYERSDFNALPVIAAYRSYYKLFKKSYHVQLQLESIVLKGKTLPNVNPLVDLNFMAEMQTLVLAAGHDVDKLNQPIQFDLSREGDKITQLNGEIREMRSNDMIMRDASQVSCSIIYGQDNQSPISQETTRALYVVYAPDGVPEETIQRFFTLLKQYILIFSNQAQIEQQRLITAKNNE